MSQIALAFQRFTETPLSPLLDAPGLIPEAEARALALFTHVASSVPAYRAFLRGHGVEPEAVRTLDAFRGLPLLTREGYVRRYPLADRCRGGDLSSCDMVAVSSGSTGEPTFWPRALADEFSSAERFEQVFGDAFAADRLRTLAIVCFPLGAWVGGMFTTACCRHLAAKGYRLTVVTPGNQRAEILRVARALAPGFEQTVLLGYPPFLKDVVDAGLAEALPWHEWNVKLVFAGEVFSEGWRSLMAKRTGSADVAVSSASLYGTADGGVLGNETPLSVCIRRFLAERPAAAAALFGKARLPTLVQYDPRTRYFEEHEGTLVVSSDGGVPLVRYHIADEGGVVPYLAMLERMRSLGFDAEDEARRAGARAIRRLPFVYVFGRAHFAISYYGANVFPETVSLGLEKEDVCAHVTGKFVMEAREEEAKDLTFALAVELAPDVPATPALAERVADAVLAELLRCNSEFAGYVPVARQRPLVTLWPTGDPEYFPVGVKHRYSRAR